MKIFLLPQAVEDLDLVQEPLFSKVVAKIQLLKEFPSLGPPMDGPFSGYRVLTVGLFRVFYRLVSSDHIEISYIRHAKRNLP